MAFGHFHGIAVNNLGIFISDGVVSPEIWYSQNVRIVFLLKEAYTKNGDSDWDLVKLNRSFFIL